METEENFYEEALNHEDMYGKKKKHSFKWVIWVILVLLLLFVGILTYLKLTEKEEETEPEKEETIEVEKIDLDCDSTCEYKVNVSGSEVVLKYTIITGTSEEATHKLEIDGTTIVNKSFACGGPASLGVLEDVILISFHDGCDIVGNTIHAYKKDGTEILNYEILDTTYNMWVESTEFQIKEKTIYIPATRLYHGPTLRLNANQEVNVCEESEWENYNVDSSTIVSGTYEITYEGNSKFSEPILTSKKELKDIIDSCTLED